GGGRPRTGRIEAPWCPGRRGFHPGEERMSASLRALLAGILDYAGLFPPPRLPLEPAVRNYARYRTEPEAWLLRRFVCPAARLAELAPVGGQLFRPEALLAGSALGRRSKPRTDLPDALRVPQ